MLHLINISTHHNVVGANDIYGVRCSANVICECDFSQTLLHLNRSKGHRPMPHVKLALLLQNEKYTYIYKYQYQ
jgi:hypothetical protein